MCDHLDGDVCAEFGLELEILDRDRDSSETGLEICNTQVVYGATVNTSNTLRVNFWSSFEKHDFNFRCYFWCTRDGKVPKSPGFIYTDDFLWHLFSKARSFSNQVKSIFICKTVYLFRDSCHKTTLVYQLSANVNCCISLTR